MGNLRRILPFIKPYRWEALGALLLLLGVVVADLLVPRLTQRVIDQGVANQDMAAIVSTSLMMLGAALLSALFAVANSVLSVRVAINVSADLRSSIVRKVQTFSFGNLDRQQTGQLLVRTTSDVSQVEMIVQMSLRILTRAPLWMLGSAVMLVATSRRLMLIMLVLLPIIGVVIGSFLVWGRPLFLSVQRKLDRLNQVLQENLAGVRVVKAFVRADHENARFEEANLALTQQTTRVMRLVAVMIPTMMLLVNLAIVGVVWYGGQLVIGGSFTAGEIVASVNYMSFTLFPLMMLAGMIGPVSAADASAGRIMQVLDTAPDVQDTGATKPLAKARGRVTFEGVCFDYNHGCSEPVLEDIDLVAEPGQTVAILGATGSGKSTLVNLIPRFYEVDEGRITLDGVDVRDIPMDELRENIGVALQESVLFTGTIRDNIRYGRPEATEEDVVAAAKASQADDFVRDLPYGYDTLVSQRGANLSGGQKQRIAIARALLTRPRVLILDDSTSAVDVETEARIHEAIDEMMAHSTSFVIAQRISTVLNADQIVVLDRGRVVARGTHDQLLSTSRLYREIYESQLGSGGRSQTIGDL